MTQRQGAKVHQLASEIPPDVRSAYDVTGKRKQTAFNKLHDELPIVQADGSFTSAVRPEPSWFHFRRGRARASACARTKSHDATFLIMFFRRTFTIPVELDLRAYRGLSAGTLQAA